MNSGFPSTCCLAGGDAARFSVYCLSFPLTLAYNLSEWLDSATLPSAVATMESKDSAGWPVSEPDKFDSANLDLMEPAS